MEVGGLGGKENHVHERLKVGAMGPPGHGLPIWVENARKYVGKWLKNIGQVIGSRLGQLGWVGLWVGSTWLEGKTT